MAYVDLGFGEISGEGSDFTIGTLTGLPKIPSNASLNSVILTFTARRNSGTNNDSGEVRIEIGGTTVTVKTGIKRDTDYPNISFNMTNYVVNNGGVLSYTHGNTSINIRGYHSWNLFLGASWWRIFNINIRVDYYPVYYYTTVASPPEGGVVYDYGGVSMDGKTTKVEAIPNPGYRFLGWYKNGVYDSSEMIYYPILSENNVVFTAYFEKIPPPKFTSAEMIYNSKQISRENKVIAGQGFIISVAVT